MLIACVADFSNITGSFIFITIRDAMAQAVDQILLFPLSLPLSHAPTAIPALDGVFLPVHGFNTMGIYFCGEINIHL